MNSPISTLLIPVRIFHEAGSALVAAFHHVGACRDGASRWATIPAALAVPAINRYCLAATMQPAHGRRSAQKRERERCWQALAAPRVSERNGEVTQVGIQDFSATPASSSLGAAGDICWTIDKR